MADSIQSELLSTMTDLDVELWKLEKMAKTKCNTKKLPPIRRKKERTRSLSRSRSRSRSSSVEKRPIIENDSPCSSFDCVQKVQKEIRRLEYFFKVERTKRRISRKGIVDEPEEEEEEEEKEEEESQDGRGKEDGNYNYLCISSEFKKNKKVLNALRLCTRLVRENTLLQSVLTPLQERKYHKTRQSRVPSEIKQVGKCLNLNENTVTQLLTSSEIEFLGFTLGSSRDWQKLLELVKKVERYKKSLDSRVKGLDLPWKAEKESTSEPTSSTESSPERNPNPNEYCPPSIQIDGIDISKTNNHHGRGTSSRLSSSRLKSGPPSTRRFLRRRGRSASPRSHIRATKYASPKQSPMNSPESEDEMEDVTDDDIPNFGGHGSPPRSISPSYLYSRMRSRSRSRSRSVDRSPSPMNSSRSVGAIQPRDESPSYISKPIEDNDYESGQFLSTKDASTSSKGRKMYKRSLSPIRLNRIKRGLRNRKKMEMASLLQERSQQEGDLYYLKREEEEKQQQQLKKSKRRQQNQRRKVKDDRTHKGKTIVSSNESEEEPSLRLNSRIKMKEDEDIMDFYVNEKDLRRKKVSNFTANLQKRKNLIRNRRRVKSAKLVRGNFNHFSL